jgi:hypothetical protein
VLILPVTALIETGNFIAQISDGDARRKTAKHSKDSSGLRSRIKHHGGFTNLPGELSFWISSSLAAAQELGSSIMQYVHSAVEISAS